MSAADDFFINNELRITCSDAVTLVTDYLENALMGTDLANYEQHLSLCEGCKAFAQQIDKTIAFIGATKSPIEVEPARLDALVQKFEQDDSTSVA